MLSKKHVSSQIKKWGFASCHEDVHEKLNRAIVNLVKRLGGQHGGRIVLPPEWFGVESGSHSADAAPGSTTAPNESWIRSPLAAHDPTGSIVGGRQRGGRIVEPSEWYGVDSGRYSADAAPGSSTLPTEAWIRSPLQASDPTGAIVGGGARFAVTQKAIAEACKSAGVVLSAAQKKGAKAYLETTLSDFFSTIRKKNRAEQHISLAAFDAVFKMRKYNKLR